MRITGTPRRATWSVAFWAALVAVSTALIATPAAAAPGAASSGPALLSTNDDYVSGHTTDADGKPIAGAQIRFEGMPEVIGGTRLAWSNSDGRYWIRLRDGAYRVTARYFPPDQPDYPVRLVTGDDQSARIQVPPGGSVNFTVP
jgi:hypothetical protein